LQGAIFYALASRRETTPPAAPLDAFPAVFQGWTLLKDAPVTEAEEEVLRADDTMNRWYVRQSDRAAADLFVAYFKTQRTGASPHSPKNCLPGAGWEPVEPPGRLAITVAGRPAPIGVNRYVVAKGEQQSVVLYWYEGHNRVIASEFAAKFWLIADAIRYRRSDTALVKVVVPVLGGETDPAAGVAVQFVQDAYPSLRAQLPL
jgi:EpsI family protein